MQRCAEARRRPRTPARARPIRRRRRETGGRASRRSCRRRSPRRRPRPAAATRARRASRRETARAPSANRSARRRRRRAGLRWRLRDPPRLGVDGDAAVTHPPAERHTAIGGELDGERRRGADRDEHGTSRDRSFLHELEGEPPADAQDVLGEREQTARGTTSRPPCPSRCAGRRPRERIRALPSQSKSPVACRPPVAANARWASRSSSGSLAITSERTSSVLSIRGALTSIASIAPFPHTPHEDEV